MKAAGLSSLFQRWQELWCVLNIERAQLRLDCLAMDELSSSMQKAKSVVLDPLNAVALDKPVLACAASARLFIREQGSGRLHRLACESPEEAERLLKCMTVLLGSLGSTNT